MIINKTKLRAAYINLSLFTRIFLLGLLPKGLPDKLKRILSDSAWQCMIQKSVMAGRLEGAELWSNTRVGGINTAPAADIPHPGLTFRFTEFLEYNSKTTDMPSCQKRNINVLFYFISPFRLFCKSEVWLRENGLSRCKSPIYDHL